LGSFIVWRASSMMCLRGRRVLRAFDKAEYSALRVDKEISVC
jgi:hypothetical protein